MVINADETYNLRNGIERTNESVNDCGLGRTHARGYVHGQAQCSLHCDFALWSQLPTTNVDTVPVVP